MLDFGDTREAFGERGCSVIPEGGDGFSCLRVQRKETVATVNEHTELAAVAPEGGSAKFESAGGQHLTQLVALTVKAPKLLAGLGVQRGYVVVRRGYIKDAIDHQWSAFEETGSASIFAQRHIPVLPLPGDLKA